MAASIETLVASMLSEFQSLTKKPEEYLGSRPIVANKFKKSTKRVYDFTKRSEKTSNEALPELIIDSFDDEQIWQQIELQNGSVITSLLNSVSHAVTSKNISFGVHNKAEEKSIPKTILKTQRKALRPKNESDDDDFNSESDEAEIGENIEAYSGSEIDTDTEIDKIKSRLKSSKKEDDILEDEDSEDLDFDFGGLENEGEEIDISDEEQKETIPPDRYKLEDGDNTKKQKSRKKDSLQQSSIVDDKFFKLSQMELFLDQEDKKEAKKIQKEDEDRDSEDESSEEDGEEVDMFGDLSSEEDEETEDRASRKMKYVDFFPVPDGEEEPAGNESESSDSDTPKRKKVRFSDQPGNTEEGSDSEVAIDEKETGSPSNLQSDSDSEGEDLKDIIGGKKPEEQTNFEKRQERLKKKISSMEEASLAEKPWQLAGEVTSARRPENSLLEEFLQFDQTTKLPPVITEETTKSIEQIIIQRIKDEAWDDVERKVKPKEDPFEYKKRVVLDQEKSKQSLGEIYEQEYLKQQQKEKEETKDPDREEIKKEMRDLFLKLDALSNFHFTPKPAAPEIRVVSNLPSINMEEVAPVSVSDATLLAPQEVQDKTKGEEKGQTEKMVTDRKRERREKKAAKRARQKEREKREKLVTKLHPGLGNKYSKEKAMKELEKSSKQDGAAVKVIKDKSQKKSSVSSKTFFTQLQEEVVSQIHKKKLDKGKKAKLSDKSSKKLKL